MDFLTVEQISETLSVSEKTVYNYIKKGDLKAYKFGASWKVKPSDLNDFIESRSNIKSNSNTNQKENE